MAKKARKSAASTCITKEGFVNGVFKSDIPDYVILELKYEAPVAFTAEKFAAPSAAESQAESLNKILEKYRVQTMRSHF